MSCIEYLIPNVLVLRYIQFFTQKSSSLEGLIRFIVYSVWVLLFESPCISGLNPAKPTGTFSLRHVTVVMIFPMFSR